MSKDRDGRVSQAQMKKLLDILSIEGCLMGGRVIYKNTNKVKFWKRIEMELNSVENGAVKKFHKWCKMWADWKDKTKRKADVVVRRKFGNLRPNFTKLELRLLRLINYSAADSLLSILNEEQDCKGPQHDKTDVSDEDLSDDCDDNSSGAYNEESREFVSLNIQDDKESTYDILFDKDKIVTEIGTANVKLEETATYTESLEYNKTKVQLALEKERIHQKNEELRLKAIELKLKADELKLQESESGRVKYLTQLEEQKLKCMTDIAAALKELVELTRNGTTRFHNVM